MAGEVEALLETMRLRREAEAKLRQATAPSHRPRGGSLHALAETVAEWQGAECIAWQELRAAAERGDPEATAFLDVADTERARREG